MVTEEQEPECRRRCGSQWIVAEEIKQIPTVTWSQGMMCEVREKL
jgi:hypothetical protein